MPTTDDVEVWAVVLARLADEQFGLLLVDLAAPGVTVIPRPMIGEHAGYHGVSRLQFDQVAVAATAMVGSPGAGLQLAGHIERWQLARAGATARNRVLLAALREAIAAGDFDGGTLWADAACRRKLHELEVELAGLEALEARSLDGTATFSAAARLALAARGAVLSEQLADLQVEVLGYFALPLVAPDILDNEGPVGPVFAQAALLGMLSDRAREAVGAPREHLKNIIAKSVLALPLAARSKPD